MNAASLLHRRVRFRVSDVRVPSEVLGTLFGEEMIEGEVVDWSDAGNGEYCFVVVCVRDPLVVHLRDLPQLVVPATNISLIEANDI